MTTNDKRQLNITIFSDDLPEFERLKTSSPLKTPALFHDMLIAYKEKLSRDQEKAS